jgi:hypothetical protein
MKYNLFKLPNYKLINLYKKCLVKILEIFKNNKDQFKEDLWEAIKTLILHNLNKIKAFNKINNKMLLIQVKIKVDF